MLLVVTLILVIITPPAVYGGSDNTMPYGDYLQWCSAYGMCKENLGPKEAENAIEKYFMSKGLKARNMRHKDRFIEAEIYRENHFVDRVILDRKSGRMRSTY